MGGRCGEKCGKVCCGVEGGVGTALGCGERWGKVWGSVLVCGRDERRCGEVCGGMRKCGEKSEEKCEDMEKCVLWGSVVRGVGGDVGRSVGRCEKRCRKCVEVCVWQGVRGEVWEHQRSQKHKKGGTIFS